MQSGVGLKVLGETIMNVERVRQVTMMDRAGFSPWAFIDKIGKPLALVGALVLAACTTTTPTQPLSGNPLSGSPLPQVQAGAGGQGIIGNAPPNLQDYRLGNDDQIRLTVFNQDNLSGEFTVGSTGALTLPLIGQMPAAGKTANELGQEIAIQLQDGYLRNPQVNVEVIRYRPFFIVGGVNRPGQFDYVPGMTVLQAVAIAGGYSLTGAQGQNVIISRNSRGSSGPSFGSMTTPVFPGDTIEVPQVLLPTTTVRPGPRF